MSHTALQQRPASLGDYRTLHDRLALVQQDLLRVMSVVCNPAPTPTYIGDGLVFIPTALGFPIIGFSDDLQVTASLLTKRTWDPATTQVLERALRPGDAFLDAGANIGYFTVFGAMQVGYTGRVHAFEPNHRTFDVLSRNVRLNECGHVVEVHHVALADSEGDRVLHTFRRNQGGSTLSDLPDQLLAEWHERPDAESVPATTLDAVFRGTRTVFSCIKMDTEGSEAMIWAGGDRFFREHVDDGTLILLEWNPPALAGAKADPHALMALFARYGFSVWRRDEALVATPVNEPADLDDWRISELLLARHQARLATVCP